jgi:cardiolipin synthase
MHFSEWESPSLGGKKGLMWSSSKAKAKREVLERAKSPSEPSWTEGSFLLSGQDYFEAVLKACASAKSSIRLESYIFDNDGSGRKILSVLTEAARRGVKVRLIIDAIGSPRWRQEDFEELRSAGGRVRIFGRPRDILLLAIRRFFRGRFIQSFLALRKFQFRNHRKLLVIDERRAWVGSANIGDRFMDWRETTIALAGPAVSGLKQTFVRSWRLAAREPVHDEKRWRGAIRTNFTRYERIVSNMHLLARIALEAERLHITTAYFFPRPRLLFALFQALKRGVDLRIVVPKNSDIAWFPWVSRAVFVGLIEKGAKVYEYDGGMMHAKSIIFSSEALVGSTNMNYRSFVHDLELDVILSEPEMIEGLESIFAEDMSRSVFMSREKIRGYAPFAFLVSLILTPLKRWI